MSAFLGDIFVWKTENSDKKSVKFPPIGAVDFAKNQLKKVSFANTLGMSTERNNAVEKMKFNLGWYRFT